MPADPASPRPWEVYDDRHIRVKDDEHIAEACEDADARRIVACVNACAGLADPEHDVAELVAALENIRDYPSPTAALLQFIARDALARHAPGREAKA